MEDLVNFDPHLLKKMGFSECQCQNIKLYSISTPKKNNIHVLRFIKHTEIMGNCLKYNAWRIIYNKQQFYRIFPKTATTLISGFLGMTGYYFNKRIQDSKQEIRQKERADYYVAKERNENWITRNGLVRLEELREFAGILAFINKKERDKQLKATEEKEVDEIKKKLENLISKI